MKRVILALATAAGAAYLLKRRRSQRAQHAHDIEGKVALITGSSRGLGFVLAQQLAERGARVALCARDEDELTQARERIAGDGGDVIALRCDVSDRSQVQRTVSETAARLGPIDILVNNAGIITVGPLESQTVEDFREAMDIMYWGTVYSTLEVLPEMRRRRSGHIVNITSIGGKVSVPHLLPYNAAKFAAVGFSEGLHAEEAGNGIHVLTVARADAYGLARERVLQGRQPRRVPLVQPWRKPSRDIDRRAERRSADHRGDRARR